MLPLHSIIDGHCTCAKPDCSSAAKHPRTEHGLTDASTDPAQITAWWNQWLTANIGVTTGQHSRIVVLDCDIKNGGPDRLRELMDRHGAINTLTSITGGGGQHWVFQAPANPLRNTASAIAPGIDTRAEGGYIVAPPSVHLSGHKYEWDNRVRPQPVPEWLLLLWPTVTPPAPAINGTAPTAEHPTWIRDALAYGAGQGQRNNLATRVIGYFHSKGIPRDVILETVQQFAQRCRPPIELPELQNIINSVLRYQTHLRDANISDPPEFSEIASTLIYTWATPDIAISIDQLHRNGLGLQSEIVITGNGVTIHGPVHYNLTSTSARDTLVRYLNKRMETNWPEILETLSRLTVAHSRTGDPVSDLKEYLKRPGSQWVLRPFILEDQPTILFGAGGLGKSILALAMMLGLESDNAILPGTASQPGHHGLYLDWEDTAYQHGERYRQLCAGKGLKPKDYDLLHLRCTGTITEEGQRIHHQIADSAATYLIVDSAGLACGGEPEKSEAALMFFATLRTFKLPALVIAHQTKGNSRGMPFGSVFWSNAARMTWEIASKQRPGGTGLQVSLTNCKSNVSSLLGSIGYNIAWTSDSIAITSLDLSQVPELSNTQDLTDKLHAAFTPREQGLTVSQLAELLGSTSTPDSIRTTMKRHPLIFREDDTPPKPYRWFLVDARYEPNN